MPCNQGADDSKVPSNKGTRHDRYFGLLAVTGNPAFLLTCAVFPSGSTNMHPLLSIGQGTTHRDVHTPECADAPPHAAFTRACKQTPSANHRAHTDVSASCLICTVQGAAAGQCCCVTGTVTNVAEASAWLSYTYLFVRMLHNPLAYGIPWEELAAEPRLEGRRRSLVGVLGPDSGWNIGAALT